MTEIKELNIRIPGITGKEGEDFGRSIAAKVAAAIPGDLTGRFIPGIRIQLHGTASMDRPALADHIAQQIIRQINLSIF
jgi:hypothetical protein